MLLFMSVLPVSQHVQAQEVRDSVRIYFRQGRSELDMSVRNNRAALGRIADSLSTSYADSVYILRKILVEGGASPEGSIPLNRKLSEKRAKTLFGYLAQYVELPYSLTTFRFIGRDWTGLLRLAEADEDLPYREQTLDFLRQVAEKTQSGERAEDNYVGKLARLAVRDASNRIMWSWHIWVTERPVYTERHILQDLFVGSNTYELMQCNLGWVDGKMVYYNQRDLTFRFTQAGSGKTDELIVRQEGETFDYKDVGSTYYQWGRKDPLVALKNWNSYGYKDYRLHETGDPNYVYRYETGPTDIGNAIQHPNVFYTRGTTGGADWNKEHITTLWNARDNGGTLESTTSVKTIYDPSPRGFKVPIPRAFAVWVNGHAGDESTKGELNGYVFVDVDNVHNKYRVYPQASGRGTEITLTATGQRADIGGKLEVYEQDRPLKAEVGGLWSLYGVYYWTCVPKNTTSANTLVIRKDFPSGVEVYSYGFSGTKTMARPVRPIADR